MSKGGREEAMAAANSRDGGDYPHVVVKGKRTKRMRLLQAISPASSSAELSGSTTTTEEEEDMANCLILLAQGSEARPGLEDAGGEKVSSDRVSAEAAPAVVAKEKAGFCAYECKTCNKCFPSFQALGGHRASHKKSKTSPAAAEETPKMTTDEESIQIRISGSYSPTNNITAIGGSGGANNNGNGGGKPRVHECSICGSEFSSGQALGGHMRRHRAPAAAEPPETKKAARNGSGGLSLDLNLPAPADDDLGDFPLSPSFAAFSAGRPLVFSGSALVGCHY